MRGGSTDLSKPIFWRRSILQGLECTYIIVFRTSKPSCSSFFKHMWVPLSSKPLLDTLDMYPASLGIHLIIRYRHNGKVSCCPSPIFYVLLILVVRITIPPSIPPSHMYAPMSLNRYPRKGAGGIRLMELISKHLAYFNIR